MKISRPTGLVLGTALKILFYGTQVALHRLSSFSSISVAQRLEDGAVLIPITFASLERVAPSLQVSPRLALTGLFDELVHALHERIVRGVDECSMKSKIPLLKFVVLTYAIGTQQATFDLIEVV